MTLYKAQTTMNDINGTTKQGWIRKGVKLAYLLSSYLFNIFIEISIDELKNKTKGININERKVHNIRLADEIILLTEFLSDMNKMFNTLVCLINSNYRSMDRRQKKVDKLN